MGKVFEMSATHGRTMIDGDSAAFASSVKDHGGDITEIITGGGLTKRELFAGLALQGLSANHGYLEDLFERAKIKYPDQDPHETVDRVIAGVAVERADNLIKALGEN